jgi:hypothetical protein
MAMAWPSASTARPSKSSACILAREILGFGIELWTDDANVQATAFLEDHFRKIIAPAPCGRPLRIEE